MHGFIFSEIQDYVSTKLGAETWKALLREAGLANRQYEKFIEYPDEEAVKIVMTASEMTSQPATAILEDFGRFLGPHLLKVYRPLINPSWKTLDFLEHTEETIHRVVRSRNRMAKPPALAWTRTGPEEVVLKYSSPRRMQHLAIGIAKGVADEYGDSLDVAMDDHGDAGCTIRFRLASATAGEADAAAEGAGTPAERTTPTTN
ncbi:MAG: heme NO-binding domain-containing protein [Acidobacteriota bacterium]